MSALFVVLLIIVLCAPAALEGVTVPLVVCAWRSLVRSSNCNPDCNLRADTPPSACRADDAARLPAGSHIRRAAGESTP